MPAPTACLNLARTSAALASYDAARAALDSSPTTTAFRAEDDATRLVGRAYALDTCDRNDPTDAAKYAGDNPDRVRAIVEEYRADVAAGRRIAQPCEVTYTVALTVAGVFRDG